MIDQEKVKNYTQATLEQGEDRLKNALSEAEKKVRQGQEQVTKWAEDINKRTHDNPWPIVAGVGMGCLLLGLILGKSKN